MNKYSKKTPKVASKSKKPTIFSIIAFSIFLLVTICGIIRIYSSQSMCDNQTGCFRGFFAVIDGLIQTILGYIALIITQVVIIYKKWSKPLIIFSAIISVIITIIIIITLSFS